MRIDDDIIALGRRLRDLEGLPESQVEQILADYLNRAGRDNLEQYLENLQENIADVREELEEARDELRELERGEERDQARDDLDEVKKYLREFEQLVDEVYQGITDHYRDFTNGSDVNISSDSLEINAENNGSTFIYTLSGANNSPFGAGAEANPLEGVTRDGTNATEVIKDVNNDTVLNYADIEAALEQANTALLSQQNVFINTDPSWHWELQPGSGGGATTFSVTKGEESILVTFENSASTVFYFQSGLTEADIGTAEAPGAVRDWPPDLLQRMFWGDSTKSFWDMFQLPPDRLSVIDGYGDVQGNIDSQEVRGITGASLSDEGKEKVAQALDIFFSTIDDPTISIDHAWDDVIDLGLTPNEIRSLLLTLAIERKDYFARFIGPRVPYLEDLLNPDGDITAMSDVDIAITILMETHAAPGNYGGVEMLTLVSGETTSVTSDVVTELGRAGKLTAVLNKFKNILREHIKI